MTFEELNLMPEIQRAVEAMGFPVRLSEGDAENIKITRPMDLVTAEAILARREKA